MKKLIPDFFDRSAEVKEKRFDLVEILTSLAVVLTPFLSFFEQISIFINETIGYNGVLLGAVFIFIGFYLALAVIRRKEEIDEVVYYQYVQTRRIIAKISFFVLLIFTGFYINFTYQYFKPLSNVIEGHLICSTTQLPATDVRVDVINDNGESVLKNQFFVTDESGYFLIYSNVKIKRGYSLVFTDNNGTKKQYSLRSYKNDNQKNTGHGITEKIYYLPFCH